MIVIANCTRDNVSVVDLHRSCPPAPGRPPHTRPPTTCRRPAGLGNAQASSAASPAGRSRQAKILLQDHADGAALGDLFVIESDPGSPADHVSASPAINGDQEGGRQSSRPGGRPDGGRPDHHRVHELAVGYPGPKRTASMTRPCSRSSARFLPVHFGRRTELSLIRSFIAIPRAVACGHNPPEVIATRRGCLACFSDTSELPDSSASAGRARGLRREV